MSDQVTIGRIERLSDTPAKLDPNDLRAQTLYLKTTACKDCAAFHERGHAPAPRPDEDGAQGKEGKA